MMHNDLIKAYDELDRLRAENVKLRKITDAQIKAEFEARAENERLTKDQEQRIDRAAKYMNRIGELKAENDRLRANYSELVATHTAAVSDMGKELDRLRAENERLSAMSCPDLVPEVARLRASNKQLADLAIGLEERLVAAQVKLDRLRAENAELRKGIQDYLDDNYDGRPPRRGDKCLHETYSWLACQQCIDAHFVKLLRQQLVNDSLNTTTNKD